jgi:serine/threonine protein kinase
VIMERLLDAVAYMHLNNVVHRDIKLENLVLKQAGDLSSVIVVDFGFAKAARAREKMEDVVGTKWYSAPELLVCDPYTPAVDLWALGVGLYMLLSGEVRACVCIVLLVCDPYTPAVDLWALGVGLYMLLSGEVRACVCIVLLVCDPYTPAVDFWALGVGLYMLLSGEVRACVCIVLLVCDPYTPAVDLWALGVGLYMLLSGEVRACVCIVDPSQRAVASWVVGNDLCSKGRLYCAPSAWSEPWWHYGHGETLTQRGSSLL